jgi:hypothetical protein
MKANRLASYNFVKMAPAKTRQNSESAIVALRALYELLEDYGPMWYTEEAHNLATAALGENVPS